MAGRRWSVAIALMLILTTLDATESAAADPVLVGAGDIASCASASDTATATLLDGIPGTIFAAGDNAYESGSAAEYVRCYEPTWGRHRWRTRPAPGNHDYATPGAVGYFAYFGASAGNQTRGYYSYALGAWHVVVLNSNCGAVGGCYRGSQQERWLRADLASHPARCTLSIWHHPRFSSGAHGSDQTYQPFWQALYDYRADVVIAGHDHDYERFAPQNASGGLDTARGLREFVVGTGGRSLNLFGTIRPNSERRGRAYGVLKLTLHSTSYQWSFVPVAPSAFSDGGTTRCH
jgi:calcineurin-like phosphoesterase family protein